MIPFKALYGRRCRSLVGWFEVGEIALIGPELDSMEMVRVVRKRLKAAENLQKILFGHKKKGGQFQC